MKKNSKVLASVMGISALFLSACGISGDISGDIEEELGEEYTPPVIEEQETVEETPQDQESNEEAPAEENTEEKAPPAESGDTSEGSSGSTIDTQVTEFFNDFPDGSSTSEVVDYDRSDFSHWDDINGNGCDARNDTLQRDMTSFESDDGCEVQTGVLEDSFTGNTINFERGGDYENGIDIDHIVPLGYAAEHGGAMGWTDEQRQIFANDPANLLAVDPGSNRAKGAAGPAEWMPDNESYHCEYATIFMEVSERYSIDVPAEDSERANQAC